MGHRATMSAVDNHTIDLATGTAYSGGASGFGANVFSTSWWESSMELSGGVALAQGLTAVVPRPHPLDASVDAADDDSGDDPLRSYLREIHAVALLTAADERELACRIEER